VTKALITGIPGFAGSYLARALLDEGYEVYGTGLDGEPTDKLKGIISKIKITSLDLRDRESTEKLIKRVSPSYVYHLAGISSVGKSFEDPELTFQVNVLGTVNLLESLRTAPNLSKVVVVSSSDIYGVIDPKNLPISEDHPIRPVTPYGISKAAIDMLGYQYFKSYGLPIVRARAFNHTGPCQENGFVIPDFCSQVAEIEAGGLKPVMRVGNLESYRDISDVRDIVRGYKLLADKGEPGEAFNLCSGKAEKIQDLLKYVLGKSSTKITTESNPALMRPSETPRLIGDCTKAHRCISFVPKYNVHSTIDDTLEYWRDVVKRSR